MKSSNQLIKIKIRETFKDDFITRVAGERLRNLIISAAGTVEIDFSKVTIGSTSFFDEAIAKLTEEGWNSEKVSQKVKFKELNPFDKKVLVQICKFRGLNLDFLNQTKT